MIQRRAFLKRSPLKRKPPKARTGDDPAYRDWLKKWPCYVCLREHFNNPQGFPFHEVIESPSMRLTWLTLLMKRSGQTQVAHVGQRGLRQKCKDREAMPLCAIHHLHQTAGGGPESHHTLGKGFWEHHALERNTVIAILNRLYEQESGK